MIMWLNKLRIDVLPLCNGGAIEIQISIKSMR